LVLIGLKVWAWRATDSVALLGSLADSLLDLMASLITFFALRVALSPADREHRFGHGKSEGVAGIAQALIVAGSAVFVTGRAITRLIAPGELSQPALGIAVMVVSLVLSAALVGFQSFVVRRTGSLAVAADSVHYKADLLTGLAVLVAIFLSTRLGWHAADPVLGLLIAAVILVSAYRIGRAALDMLLDRELPSRDRRRIHDVAAQHRAVLGVHDIRTRSAGTAEFIQLHIELDPALTLAQVHEISEQVERAVRNSFPNAEVLIHADAHGVPDPRDPF
jgi:ferrous-iron efflux pump FieF